MSDAKRESHRSTVTMVGKPTGIAEWQPGALLYRRFEVVIRGSWLPCPIRLALRADFERHRVDCLAVSFEPSNDRPLSPADLRQPLAELVRVATAAALMPGVTYDDGRRRWDPTGTAELVEIPSRARPARVEDAVLQEAADIYRKHADDKPTTAVMKYHSQRPISYSTAARWVMSARKRGFLAPAASSTGRRKPTTKEEQQ